MRGLPPFPGQTLGAEDEARARLGANGPRDVSGQVMTHRVPNERAAVSEGHAPVG